MFTTSETYPWSFVTQIFHNGQPSHSGDRKIFEVMTSTLPKGTLGSVVASLLAATLYQGNPDKKHKLWNIRCTGSDADDTDVKDVDKLVVLTAWFCYTENVT